MSAKKSPLWDTTMLYTPVAAGVVFGAFGWHALGLDLWFVALVTLVHLSFSYRLTQVIKRFLAIGEAARRRPVMRFTVAFLGAVICLGDAAIVHTGLDWMMRESAMTVPALIVWAASICLSVYNMAADWGFGSAVEPAAGPLAETPAEDVKGRVARLAAEPRPVFTVVVDSPEESEQIAA